MAKYCVNCGTKLDDEDNACYNCGTMVKKENTDVGESKKTVVTKETPNYFAISGFIVSIVSTVLCCSMFNLVSLGLSIAGLANLKQYNNGKGFAIAGIIISIIPLILLIVYFILAMFGITTVNIGGYDI